MRYRTLGKAICQQMAADFVSGRHVSIDAKAGSEGTGDDVDEESLIEILRYYRMELETSPPKDNELFEGSIRLRFEDGIFRQDLGVENDG